MRPISAATCSPAATSAMTCDAYRAFFIERTTEAAVRAWTSRTPGQVTPAVGHAVLGWCRRTVYADGTGQMYGKTQRDDFRQNRGSHGSGHRTAVHPRRRRQPHRRGVSIACTPQTCMCENFLTADFWDPHAATCARISAGASPSWRSPERQAISARTT